MKTIFETFTHNKIKHLAVPDGNGNVTIVDEHGYNYGSYFSRESYEDFRKRGEAVALCVCRLEVAAHRVPLQTKGN